MPFGWSLARSPLIRYGYAQLVRPGEQFLHLRRELPTPGQFAGVDRPSRAIDGYHVAGHETKPAHYRVILGRLDIGCTNYSGNAPPTRDHGGVRRQPAVCRQHARRPGHATYVFGRGLRPDEDHRLAGTGHCLGRL